MPETRTPKRKAPKGRGESKGKGTSKAAPAATSSTTKTVKSPNAKAAKNGSDNAKAAKNGSEKRGRKFTDGSKMSLFDAAVKIIRDTGKPGRCIDLVCAAIEKGLWTQGDGETPQNTLSSRFLANAKTDDPTVVRVARGLWGLVGVEYDLSFLDEQEEDEPEADDDE